MDWKTAASNGEALRHMREFLLPRFRWAVEDQDADAIRRLHGDWRLRVSFESVPPEVISRTQGALDRCCQGAERGEWDAGLEHLREIEAFWWSAES